MDIFQSIVNRMMSDYWGTHNSDLKQVALKDNHSSGLSDFLKEDISNNGMFKKGIIQTDA